MNTVSLLAGIAQFKMITLARPTRDTGILQIISKRRNY